MHKKILLALLGIGLLALLSGIASLAVFTSTASVPSNTFTTGTGVTISTAPTTALVTFSNMAPGDFVAPVNGIIVSNPGSLALRYAVTSTTTEIPLAAQLDMTIWDEVAEADAGTTCNATAPATVLYGPLDLGSTTAVNVIGSPTQGFQAGDRALAAAGSEVLCFRVALPLTTGNAFVSLTTTATFAFQAEQTVNNP